MNRVMKRPSFRVSERGQAMAEFALAAPVLILLLFGMTLAMFYAFRAAAVDWGVFITGVAEGAYNAPATGQVLDSVTWSDIRSALTTSQLGDDERQVQSQIQLVTSRPWAFGHTLTEAQQGQTFFRLWRFYAGPPEGEFE
ncbi:MAG: hypothetical protein Fur0022_02510 [Anaerolineales bacterium]